MTDDTSRPAVGVPLHGPVGRQVPERVTLVCVLEQKRYRPGDQAPEGYLAWHEWAEVQHKAGLRQKQCGRCGKWKYPQELDDVTMTLEARTSRGKLVTRTAPVCLKCTAAPTVKTPNEKGNRPA